MTRLRQRMLEELQRRNYSQTTIDAYIFAVQEFSQFFGRSPEGLGAEHLRRYQLWLLKEKRLASSTVEAHPSSSSTEVAIWLSFRLNPRVYSEER
jgi:integrase/recombinase XerD